MGAKMLGMVAAFGTVVMIASLPSGTALLSLERIEGESGQPLNPACALDGEIMGVSGGTMFFPEAGCTATYTLKLRIGLQATSVRYFTTGFAGTHCGTWVFGGSVVGSTPMVCAPAGTFVDAPVYAAGSVDEAFTVTWVPDGVFTPTWVNGFLDSIQYYDVL